MAKKKSASQVAVWVILALLIVGLAGFGATNFGGSVNSIGTVGDREITVNRYARELQQEMNRLSQQFGTNIGFPQAQMFGIDQAVLSRIFATAALENEAEEIGISVGDNRVRDQLTSMPGLQGLDGEFDREGYRFALQQAGMSEGEFEDGLRSDMSRGILQNAATAAAGIPESYINTLLNYGGETRDITWTSLTPEDLAEPIADPTEEELQAYWEEHQDAFMLPETRDVTYAWVTPAMIAGTIEGDDEALRRLYEDHADEYIQPERRLVERLNFTSADAAQEALDAIEAGEKTFEDVVAERGLTLADIDLGDMTEADLGPAGEAVFALTGPGLAGPVANDLGAAIYRMNGVLEAQETPFEEAREQLLVEYRTDAARRAIADMIDSTDDLLAGGATLEELADETDMEIGQIDWTDGSSEGIAAYPEFREAAAETNVGDFPEILQTSDGGIFALRVNAVNEARVEPFEDARDKVEAEWRRAETVTALAEQAASLAADMGEGTLPTGQDTAPEVAADGDTAEETAEAPADDDSTATTEEATAEDTDAATPEEETAEAPEPAAPVMNTETRLARDGFVPDTPDDFVDTVFAMAPDEVKVIEGNEGVFVVRVDAVTPPDLDDPNIAQIADQLRTQLTGAVGDDILSSFASAVQTEAGTTINQSALNAVHAQMQ
ncbi:peptidyl-prolyl cis-trans isomerase [Pseudoruegeria sp. HB172150]|uniref:peptidyl-prolyl cis-trans isomerase n=1 Tax=Pseudoruegeria sp. HB172150 TaxID=2721164 RepID=UPI001551C60E|nr:peptidyl-prolyl cis-trans isomerase [Pseudoruegeria sp. HB172150]